MNIALPKLRTSHLITNEEATRLCQIALEQKDREDYTGAQATMRGVWSGVGERPQTEGLHPSVSAEVALTAGILTSWIGSRDQINDAQETAKNLITESITYFESMGDMTRIASARTEIAYCYWRTGEANEARTMLHEALEKLTTEGTTRARALLKLTTVEWTAGRYYEALGILTDNSTLFQKLRNHTVKGSYHTEFAIVLRNLATAEKRDDYFHQAIEEYEAADHHFRLARNPIFRASVKNNVGLLLYKLGRYKAAHKYLDQARRLTTSLKDRARTADIDETRAQVFIAEGKYKEAEYAARKAALALGKSGRQRLVACALITQGIAVARLGRKEHAQLVFQRAIEVGVRVEALSAAGLAALTMIEELDQLSPETLQAAYQQARDWLATTQSADLLRRLNEAAGKVVAGIQASFTTEEAITALLTKSHKLEASVLKYEKTLIRQALIQANGSITHAASLLGTSYQALGYMIQARHPDLFKFRSPVRFRGKKSDK
jgi:tetratricopeptide (TPR) repeat protein